MKAFAQALLILFCILTGPVFAQAPPIPTEDADGVNSSASPPSANGSVLLNFPDEVPVSALADYVSKSTGISLLYDKTVAAKRVTIRAPQPIPTDALAQVLQNTLKIQGLVLIPMDVSGWYRIVEADNLPQFANPRPGGTDALLGGQAATQFFSLEYSSPEQVNTFLQPFLTQPGASSIALDRSGLLAVTDFEANLARIAKIIEQIDVPPSRRQVQFLPVNNMTAQALADQLSAILQLDGNRSSRDTNDGSDTPALMISADSRTNRLIVAGSSSELAAIIELTEKLDVPLDETTEVYTPASVSVSRIASLLDDSLPPQLADRYRVTVDEQANTLVVIGPEAVQTQVRQLLDRLDKTTDENEGGLIRFYKLQHATAAELTDTLLALQSSTTQQTTGTGANDFTGRFNLIDGAFPPTGPNRANINDDAGVLNRGQTGRLDLGIPLPPPPGFFDQTDPLVDLTVVQDANGQRRQGSAPVQTRDAGQLIASAQISSDVPSNSVIIVAEPVVQQMFASLIKKLDQPRPQVLIEAQVVSLDTSDGFSLGVEVSGGDRSGISRLLGFSSFGLSTVDPVTGALSIIPGLGFNGTLVDPEVADVVVRAFATHSRSKIISSPRVLVNDNETGTLTSVFEVPFTSVNASQTVATTSFAGFAEAGTTIVVTPHISSDDELKLDYQIILNSFTGTGAAGVPPPRQTNEIQSVVTIPDGHTLIVGGLNQTNHSQDESGIPFIERIPLIKHLAGVQNETASESSLFVFLKPVILRDDKFRGLKYLSGRDSARAGAPATFPTSQPMLIKR